MAGLAAPAIAGCERVVVLLVDQPGIGPAAVARVVEAGSGAAQLVVATYSGSWRHPVVLGRAHWAGVAQSAAGDTGARSYLRAHSDEITPVPCDDLANPADIDTAEELRAFGAIAGQPAHARVPSDS